MLFLLLAGQRTYSIMSTQYPKAKCHFPIAEYTASVQDRLRKSQCQLKQEIADIESKKTKFLKDHRAELIKLKYELDVGYKQVSVPLDQIRIPSVQMSKLGYAFDSSALRKSRMMSAPPMTFRTVETSMQVTPYSRKVKEPTHHANYWDRRASLYACFAK